MLSALPHIRPHRTALLPKNAKAHCILTGIVFGGARTWYLLHENHKRAMREINPMDSVPVKASDPPVIVMSVDVTVFDITTPPVPSQP